MAPAMQQSNRLDRYIVVGVSSKWEVDDWATPEPSLFYSGQTFETGAQPPPQATHPGT